MAKEITLTKISDTRGSLTVIENELPFDVKRIFYIYGVPKGIKRGGHGHKKTKMGLIAVSGQVLIKVGKSEENKNYILNNPQKVIILEPEEWHSMEEFSDDCTLLVMASEKYDPDDYVY